MKDSKCGRIVQQRKTSESRLIREYDTSEKFHEIRYDRVNELKVKYNLPSASKRQTPRAPFLDLTSKSNNHMLPNDNVSLSAFNEISTVNVNVNTGRREKRESLKDEYCRKVEIMNSGISNKLNKIEEELELWKLAQMQRKNQNLIKEEMNKIMVTEIGIKVEEAKSIQKNIEEIKERQLLRQRQMQREREQLEREREIQREVQIERQRQMERQREIEEELYKIGKNQSPLKLLEAGKMEIPSAPIEQMIEESQCQLLGEVKQGKVYSHEFRTLIHRLKNQISLDFEFTQLMISIPRNQLGKIKETISYRHSLADLSFFQVSPIEMDPLQPVVSYPISDLQQTAERLYQFYRKIDEHYQLKLHRKFRIETVQTLFEEIGFQELTLGHFISYINMQTGREFRNRALVKLLRRMEICSHQIDPNRFYSALCI